MNIKAMLTWLFHSQRQKHQVGCLEPLRLPTKAILVGGFNPSEKYESKWESSPNRDENKKYLKPPPSISFALKNYTQKGTRAVNTYLITHLPHLQGKVHRAALQIRDCNILCLN